MAGVYRSGGLGDLPVVREKNVPELVPGAYGDGEGRRRVTLGSVRRRRKEPQYLECRYMLVFNLTATCHLGLHVVLIDPPGTVGRKYQPFLPVGSDPVPVSYRRHRAVEEGRMNRMNGVGVGGGGTALVP